MTDAEHCDTQATLDCFRALYGFYPNLTATDRNTVVVGEQLTKNLLAEQRWCTAR